MSWETFKSSQVSEPQRRSEIGKNILQCTGLSHPSAKYLLIQYMLHIILDPTLSILTRCMLQKQVVKSITLQLSSQFRSTRLYLISRKFSAASWSFLAISSQWSWHACTLHSGTPTDSNSNIMLLLVAACSLHVPRSACHYMSQHCRFFRSTRGTMGSL